MLYAVLRGDLLETALAEDGVAPAAVRAFKVGHVLHDAQHGHVQAVQAGHVQRLLHDHGDELLRRGDDDDAVHGQGLVDRERDVAGARRHVHEHEVHVLPDELGPEFLDHAGDDGAAPDHGVGVVLQQEVHGDDVDARPRTHGKQAVLVPDGALLQPEEPGDGRAGEVGVQDGGMKPLRLHLAGQQAGDQGLAHAALAADHADDLFHGRKPVQGRLGALLLLAGGAAALPAAAALMVAIAHVKTSF